MWLPAKVRGIGEPLHAGRKSLIAALAHFDLAPALDYCARQVADVKVALSHGNGGELSHQATVLLGSYEVV